MARKRTPWNEARCDQLKAVLRDAAGLLSTDMIAETLPPRLRWMPCSPNRHEVGHEHWWWEGEQCDGARHTWYSPVMSTEIYQTLRGLERERLVERVWHSGDKRVFWRWLGSPTDVYADELEALWSMSSES